MMLLATRRKVVRVSARLWPRKSWERGISREIWVGEWRGGAHDLAFVYVAGLVKEGVHWGQSAVWRLYCSGRWR
jgi:hypothetical protein